MVNKNNVKIVIMAGGDGSRFYPYSTSEKPKQFLNFIGDKSLLQQTYDRALQLVDKSNIFISTQNKYVSFIRQQIPNFDVEKIFIEPLKRNTAMSVIYSTFMLNKACCDNIVIFMPSDHYIDGLNEYCNAIQNACELAENKSLVTIGIKPKYPSVHYGYIQSEDSNSYIKRFVEKPDYDTAKQYIDEGYYWNSGIFIWNSAFFMRELELHCPIFFELISKRYCVDNEIDRYKMFEESLPISIDYALMEKTRYGAVVKSDMKWYDLGNWDSIKSLNESGEILFSKHILDFIDKVTVKPWGHEYLWANSNGYVGKMLFIKARHQLSLQYHNEKSETMMLLSGLCNISLSDLGNIGGVIDKHVMMHNVPVEVPSKTIHRLSAVTDCIVVETSTNQLDDVVRLSDDYGRDFITKGEFHG